MVQAASEAGVNHRGNSTVIPKVKTVVISGCRADAEDVAGQQRALAKERCRSGTSFTGGTEQRSFAHGFGRKEERLADVVSFEVWVQREDGFCWLPFSHQGDDSRDRNPKTAKTRNSPHLAGIGRDPLEFHTDSVARGRR